MNPDKGRKKQEEPTLTKLHKRFIIPLFATAIALGLLAMQAIPALACGGLIAPNGAIRLGRAATLVAWHDGIERYMTSFTYQETNTNSGASLGWIVPLPAVPLKIEEGGGWTLQRLALETHPQPVFVEDLRAAVPTASGVQVLQQVKIEALDITVLKGSGQAVLDWAASNGFTVDGDTRDHLLGYAKGSPIFMAAKFDTSRARARHQLQGDGAPILITMQVPHIWIPIEVLALDGQQVQADIYLLTDKPVNTSDMGAKIGQSAVGSFVPGAPGMKLAFQEHMSPILFHDLSTDRNMSWVRSDSWLTYVSLDTPASTVNYDMGVSSSGVIRLAPFGTAPMKVVDGQSYHELPAWLPTLPMGTPQNAQTLALVLGILALVFLVYKSRAHLRAKR
jgi:Uncharacterized protein conserved in bacteria (DUF2330)